MNPSSQNQRTDVSDARGPGAPRAVSRDLAPVRPVAEQTRHRSSTRLPRRRHWGALRWHLATVLVLTLLGAGGGLLLPGLLPSGQQATTSVLIHPLEGNPYSPSTQGSDLVNLETEAQVATSDAVLAAVEQQLADGTERSELAAGLRVVVGANTQVLDLSYRTDDATEAAEVASLVAATYLQHRSDQRDAFIEGRQSALAVRITDLELRLKQLRDAGVSNLDPEVKALGGQLLNLNLQSSSTAAADGSPGQALVAAQSSRYGVRVSDDLAIGIGLVLGLLVALAVVVARERRSDLVRSVEDVESLGLAVIAEDHPSRDPAGSSEHMVPGQGPAAMAAARLLRRQVTEPRTVALAGLAATGTDGREALDLAAALSDADGSALLVDGHEEVSDADGLSEVLLGGRPLLTAVTGSAGLDVLGSGRQPDRAATLYATSRMTRLLDDASDAYTWVILDAPPAGGSQGRALVSACRYWMPLVVAGRTTRADITRSLVWAETAGVTVLGCVLVTPGPRHGRTPARSASVGD